MVANVDLIRAKLVGISERVLQTRGASPFVTQRHSRVRRRDRFKRYGPGRPRAGAIQWQIKEPVGTGQLERTSDESKTLQPQALVVEDNTLVAETIADGLSTLGYAPIEIVSTANAALEAVLNEDVNLAVLETAVRGHSTEVVMEALDSKDIAHVVTYSDSCHRAPGHAPYLRKPFGFCQLKDAVTQAIEQASVRSWNRRY